MAFNILAFPCNQFGEQEPEECPAIKRFAQNKGVEFTMMNKVDVNGIDASPVYHWLKKVAGPVSMVYCSCVLFDCRYISLPSVSEQAFLLFGWAHSSIASHHMEFCNLLHCHSRWSRSIIFGHQSNGVGPGYSQGNGC